MLLRSIRSSLIYRIALFVAMWVVLFPALLPLMHPQSAVASAGQPICHMIMAMAQHQQTPTDQQPQKKIPPCPICHALNGLGHGLVPAEIVALSRILPTPAKIEIPAAVFVAFETNVAAQPRAPPSIA